MIPFWINFLIRSFAWVIILRSQGLVNTFLLYMGFIEKPLNLHYNDAAVLLGRVTLRKATLGGAPRSLAASRSLLSICSRET